MKHFALALAAALTLGGLPLAGQPGWAQTVRHQPGILISQNVYQGYATSIAVQSPEQVLAQVEAANQIPSSIAPGIQVQHSSSLNAATDGQNIVITDTLLSKLSTNDQKAFVLSHELSHIVLNHTAKTQVRHVGFSLLDSLLGRYVQQGSLGDLAAQLGIGLIDKRSSRTYEYQADDLGVKLMKQAGYDPEAAIQVFDILQAATPGKSTPEFLQDHPITQSRIQALVKKYKLTLQ